VLFDLWSGIGIDDDDDVVESGGPGVRGQEVDDALTVLADRCQLLHPAVAPGATGGEDNERRSAQRDHRTTAEAHVIPAPKPVMSAYSPGFTRAFSRASKKASGMEELEVFP
jgi:hypothetical protein